MNITYIYVFTAEVIGLIIFICEDIIAEPSPDQAWTEKGVQQFGFFSKSIRTIKLES